MTHVGKEVRRLREEKEWSQAKLGVESGLGPSGISQIETGRRNPSAASLQRIAEALGVEVRDLFPLAQAPLPDPPEGWRSGLSPWAEHARRMADRIRQHTDDPHSPAFRDPWAALFFVEEKNREAAELYFLLFEEELERDTYDEEPLEAVNELLSAFEELAAALSEAQARTAQMGAGRTETDLDRLRRRATEATTEREKADAQFSARLERRGA